MSDKQVHAALASIYDCALDRSRWRGTLAELAGMFNASFADHYRRTHDSSRYEGVPHGLDDDDYNGLFLDTWSKRNPWSTRRPVTTAGEVLSTREILPKSELLRSEMYNDYLAPRDLHEGMRMAIWSGPEGIEDISLLRPFSMGAFGKPEVALAERLLPHLRRAATIGRRMRTAAAAAASSIAALDQVNQPMLLLDARGAVAYANPAAFTLLRRGDGLRAAGAGLASPVPAVTAQIQAAVRKAAGESGPPLAATVRLPRPSGAALAMIVMPLHRDLDWSVPEQAVILVSIADPAARIALPAAQLAELFGLTQAESAIANDLLSGEDLAVIAERSGRSIHTVRTHLSRLLAKTGMSRQTDLVRLLLAFPKVGE